jgi:hypothetical protein
MSNPISIPATLPVSGPGDGVTPSRIPVSEQGQAVKPVPLFVNPSFQFDPTVGIVVINFHDDKGTLTSSIPNQRQLAAYRSHREALPGDQSPQVPKTPSPVNGKTSTG